MICVLGIFNGFRALSWAWNRASGFCGGFNSLPGSYVAGWKAGKPGLAAFLSAWDERKPEGNQSGLCAILMGEGSDWRLVSLLLEVV